MKRPGWQLSLGIALVATTLAVYAAQILVFRDPRDTFFYMLQDLAFVPFQVLLVTFIINRLLTMREKGAMLSKLNMVIGAFYSQTGTALLERLAAFDTRPGELQAEFSSLKTWEERDFRGARKRLRGARCAVDSRQGNLEELKEFMAGERNFLLRLLENPNLLENEAFTELLWAVFHLSDELAHRRSLLDLPGGDFEHLSKDIERAYVLLVVEWIAYLSHLKAAYPYLFSMAVRTNPFDSAATVVVGEVKSDFPVRATP